LAFLLEYPNKNQGIIPAIFKVFIWFSFEVFCFVFIIDFFMNFG